MSTTFVVADREDLEAFVTTFVAASHWVEPMILSPSCVSSASAIRVARSDPFALDPFLSAIS